MCLGVVAVGELFLPPPRVPAHSDCFTASVCPTFLTPELSSLGQIPIGDEPLPVNVLNGERVERCRSSNPSLAMGKAPIATMSRHDEVLVKHRRAILAAAKPSSALNRACRFYCSWT